MCRRCCSAAAPPTCASLLPPFSSQVSRSSHPLEPCFQAGAAVLTQQPLLTPLPVPPCRASPDGAVLLQPLLQQRLQLRRQLRGQLGRGGGLLGQEGGVVAGR